MKRLLGFSATAALAAGLLLGGCTPPPSVTKDDTNKTSATIDKKDVTVGFIVKSMSDTWFPVETGFAKKEADKLGIKLLVQEAQTGDAVMSTIDSMAAQGAKGIIICSPETQLGPAIKAKCDQKGLKLMSVDDQLVDNGKPMADIPHLGISATKIGELVGTTMADEAKKRGWNWADVGVIAVLKEDLQTARERVGGAKTALTKAGLPEANFYIAPWGGSVDVASANDAANVILTQHATTKKWLCLSSNDDGMLGAVRAVESRGIPVTDIIGVGINGGPPIQKEFDTGKQSGVFASILLSPSTHGGKTVDMMVDWLTKGTEPPKLTYTSGTAITRDNYKQAMAAEGL